MRYTPPTWHNNYDNRHNLKVVKGKMLPKAAYRAHAARVNREHAQLGMNTRMVWSEITSSFVLRFIEEDGQIEPEGKL
jgi:hypothetical protein